MGEGRKDNENEATEDKEQNIKGRRKEEKLGREGVTRRRKEGRK